MFFKHLRYQHLFLEYCLKELLLCLFANRELPFEEGGPAPVHLLLFRGVDLVVHVEYNGLLIGRGNANEGLRTFAQKNCLEFISEFINSKAAHRDWVNEGHTNIPFDEAADRVSLLAQFNE